MIITIASFALQTLPRVAHAKPPGQIDKSQEWFWSRVQIARLLGHEVVLMRKTTRARGMTST